MHVLGIYAWETKNNNFLKIYTGNPYQHNHGISSPSVEHTDYSALKVEKLRQNIPKLYFFSIF